MVAVRFENSIGSGTVLWTEKNIFQRFIVDSSLGRNVATDVNQSSAA